MENNNIDLLGMEKVDRSEKSILDENNELKKQLISLQRNLEEKDKRINMLEMQLQKQIKNFSNNHVFTQVRNDTYRMSQKWDIVYKLLSTMYEKVQYINTDNFVIDLNTTLGFVDYY